MNEIESHPLSLEAAIDASMRLRAPLTNTSDFNEALQAFKERRKPRFVGE
jgi:hypothetical protein